MDRNHNDLKFKYEALNMTVYILHNEKQLSLTVADSNNIARLKSDIKNGLKCHPHRKKHVVFHPGRIRMDELAFLILL